jgi:hypothetical protein
MTSTASTGPCAARCSRSARSACTSIRGPWRDGAAGQLQDRRLLPRREGSEPASATSIGGLHRAARDCRRKCTSGNGGFYVLLDQMVYRDGGAGSQRGLTPFVSLLLPLNSSVNTMPFFANGGSGLPRALRLAPARYRPRSARRTARSAASSRTLAARCEERGQRGGDPEVRVRARAHLYRPGPGLAAGAAGPSIHHQSGGTGKIPNALVLGFQLALTL